ncbi:MAG: hypothetical protein ACYC35_23945 [Pirellulales bacterium]
MTDTMRWRYGDTNPVVIPVDAATAIEIGDLVYLATDDARPASQQADQGSETANQGALHDNFLGVAMQRSRVGDTDPIRVATTGVFEFNCPSGTFELGALVGVDEAASGTELEDQQVAGVAAADLAVGRVAKRVAAAGTRVLVDITSTVCHGGPRPDAEHAKLAQMAVQNDVISYSAAGAIAVSGVAMCVCGTGLAMTLAAPQPGCRATIVVDTITSGTLTVTTTAGVTFNGTNNRATFDAALDCLELVYKSATEWEIVRNTGSVALSSV